MNIQKKTEVVVIGIGNIGKAALATLPRYPDLVLSGVITRRPEAVQSLVPSGVHVQSIADFLTGKEIDGFLIRPNVAILCGGSCKDLLDGKQGPKIAQICNTVCSFDTHARIPEYARLMDEAARKGNNVSIFSTGWDPGTFSLARVYANAFMAGVKAYAFYGLTDKGGLSMGHSDAIRTLGGVADARQFTHAIKEAMDLVRAGGNPELTNKDMHWRECIVVLKPGVDENTVREQIASMPHYFAPYRTTVKFVSQEVLDRDYTGMPHDGVVIAVGTTPSGGKGVIEYANEWESNPEGTAGIMLAYARAAARMGLEGRSGAFTPLDVPPAYLSPHSRDELLANFM